MTERVPACGFCGRTDVTLLKDGTMRMHVRKDRLGRNPFLYPDGSRCPGWGKEPTMVNKPARGQKADMTIIDDPVGRP